MFLGIDMQSPFYYFTEHVSYLILLTLQVVRFPLITSQGLLWPEGHPMRILIKTSDRLP